jgi:hypothetical protein
LAELWRVRADQPQHLLAAGAWPSGPAATVSADSAQRVIIWWPSPDTKNPGSYKVGNMGLGRKLSARMHWQWARSVLVALPYLIQTGGKLAASTDVERQTVCCCCAVVSPFDIPGGS